MIHDTSLGCCSSVLDLILILFELGVVCSKMHQSPVADDVDAITHAAAAAAVSPSTADSVDQRPLPSEEASTTEHEQHSATSDTAGTDDSSRAHLATHASTVEADSTAVAKKPPHEASSSPSSPTASSHELEDGEIHSPHDNADELESLRALVLQSITVAPATKQPRSPPSPSSSSPPPPQQPNVEDTLSGADSPDSSPTRARSIESSPPLMLSSSVPPRQRARSKRSRRRANERDAAAATSHAGHSQGVDDFDSLLSSYVSVKAVDTAATTTPSPPSSLAPPPPAPAPPAQLSFSPATTPRAPQPTPLSSSFLPAQYTQAAPAAPWQHLAPPAPVVGPPAPYGFPPYTMHPLPNQPFGTPPLLHTSYQPTTSSVRELHPVARDSTPQSEAPLRLSDGRGERDMELDDDDSDQSLTQSTTVRTAATAATTVVELNPSIARAPPQINQSTLVAPTASSSHEHLITRFEPPANTPVTPSASWPSAAAPTSKPSLQPATTAAKRAQQFFDSLSFAPPPPTLYHDQSLVISLDSDDDEEEDEEEHSSNDESDSDNTADPDGASSANHDSGQLRRAGERKVRASAAKRATPSNSNTATLARPPPEAVAKVLADRKRELERLKALIAAKEEAIRRKKGQLQSQSAASIGVGAVADPPPPTPPEPATLKRKAPSLEPGSRNDIKRAKADHTHYHQNYQQPISTSTMAVAHSRQLASSASTTASSSAPSASSAPVSASLELQRLAQSTNALQQDIRLLQQRSAITAARADTLQAELSEKQVVRAQLVQRSKELREQLAAAKKQLKLVTSDSRKILQQIQSSQAEVLELARIIEEKQEQYRFESTTIQTLLQETEEYKQQERLLQTLRANRDSHKQHSPTTPPRKAQPSQATSDKEEEHDDDEDDEELEMLRRAVLASKSSTATTATTTSPTHSQPPPPSSQQPASPAQTQPLSSTTATPAAPSVQIQSIPSVPSSSSTPPPPTLSKAQSTLPTSAGDSSLVSEDSATAMATQQQSPSAVSLQHHEANIEMLIKSRYTRPTASQFASWNHSYTLDGSSPFDHYSLIAGGGAGDGDVDDDDLSPSSTALSSPLPQVTRRPTTSAVVINSPLRCFRAYCLSPYYTGPLLSLSTIATKIDPTKILCRFELHGVCNDEQCPWQHLRDCTLSGTPQSLSLSLSLSLPPSLSHP